MKIFIVWCLCGMIFIGLGIASFFADKPMGFWANAKMFEVTDVKKYNHAVGKMWIVFGIVFMILGIPLIEGQDSPYIIISILGMPVAVVGLMAVYTLFIEKRYKKK